MSLTITKEALNKALELRKKLGHPDDWVLSIGLSGGGCSGFMYKFDFISPPETDKHYKVTKFDNINIYCDKKSYIFLNGTEIDYEETLMSSGFVFNNPLATRSCGCGESVAFDVESLKNE